MTTSATKTYENLLIEHVGTDNRVARVTLNRPEKMNSLSQELLYEFADALHALEADDDVRVIIVRGAGRTFSAGYDLTPSRGGADGVVRRNRYVDAKGRRFKEGILEQLNKHAALHLEVLEKHFTKHLLLLNKIISIHD